MGFLGASAGNAQPPWKVLLVDDEPEVHEVTRLVLASFRFDDRPLQIISAHSASEAREILREQVAGLAVKGAEAILRREVNAGVHAELLGRLKAEL